jgi:hypothetical protein
VTGQRRGSGTGASYGGGDRQGQGDTAGKGEMQTGDGRSSGRRGIDAAAVDEQLREALAARAARLGLDPASITSPTPGALVVRGLDGAVLRLDYRTYQPSDLTR